MTGLRDMTTTEEKKFDYKDSLNLPQTTLPMKANAAVRELDIQKFWEEINVYEKNIAQRVKTKAGKPTKFGG